MRHRISLVMLWLAPVLAFASTGLIVARFLDKGFATWVQGQFGLTDETVGGPFVYVAAGLGLLVVLGYLLSLDPRSERRPLVSIVAGFLGFGWLAGFAGAINWLYWEANVQAFGIAVGGAVAAVALVLAFEFVNGWLWQSMVLKFDEKRMGGAALMTSRLALLFRPGQDELLMSVTMEQVRRGQRGELVQTIRDAYAVGDRNPDLLELLCQIAAEEKKPEEYLRYLKDLFLQFPDNDQLKDAYLEELLEQNRLSEALDHIEEFGIAEDDIDALERYANLLLGARRYSDAVEVAEKMGEVEGIPMKRSDAVLRRTLELDKNCRDAANALALHAERMARKDQMIRWLDASIAIDRTQTAVAMKLADLLEEAEMIKRLESLLHDLVLDNPRDAQMRLRYAATLHDNGKLEEAAEQYGILKAAKNPPASVVVALAGIHFERDEIAEAKSAANEALSTDLDPEQQTAMRMLLRKIERAEFTAELADLLERCTAEPQNLELQLGALRRLAAAGHSERAVAHADLLLRYHAAARPQVIGLLLEAVAGLEEGGFPILSYLADLQVAEGTYDEALETVKLMAKRALNPASAIREGAQKILRRSPHHLRTLRTMGEMYQDLGQFTEMIHAWSLYLANGGEESEQIDRSLARAYLSLNEYENAKRFVTSLVEGASDAEANRENAALLKKLIPMAIDSGHAEDAERLQEKLERVTEATDKEMRRLRGRVRESVREQRIAALRAKIDAEGGDLETFEHLGDLCIEEEEFNEAITAFQRAARQKGASRIPQAKLAYCFARKRMFDLAGETLSEIRLTLDDDAGELDQLMVWMYRTGEALEDAHMFERASKLYKQLMKIDAGYKDVIQKVEKLGKK